ncbi:uncharacterized protein ora6 [Brachyhypopomus gauderio]|uniref:uncharacterized protein ora6 n=1 Tax=Brachyhypopomus gauderio TaxID=698409 RepID=UPI0040432387
MEQLVFGILVLRIIVSVIGVVGNTILIISILRLTRLKTFEVFLLGIAASNLEVIITVDIYDIIVLNSAHTISTWSCSTLKFMTISGDVASIFFTVLIGIYRYQKLHNAAIRVITPIFMDSMAFAIGLSAGCFVISLLICVPTYMVKPDLSMNNFTTADCPPDFFQCPKGLCLTFSFFYKHLFIVFCYILPLLIVTWTSFQMIKILTVQQKVVEAHQSSEPANTAHHHHEHTEVLHRSTHGILAAMATFQMDCILFLILHLRFSPYEFPAWSELEFFIAIFYAAVIPYIYGMGHNFFSFNHIKSHCLHLNEVKDTPDIHLH